MKDGHNTNTKRSKLELLKAFYKGTKRWWRFFYLGGDNSGRIHALPILLLFGLAGILIDLDHLIIKQTQLIRPLHLPYFFGSWIIICCYVTYCVRRARNSMKKDEANEEIQQ